MNKDYVRISEFTMESGYKAAMSLFEKIDDIDTVSCATDTIAAGVIEAIIVYKKGKESIRGEENFARMQKILNETEIKVTGFGDNQFLKAVTGGIPTIHFGYKTSGIKGAELLLDAIEKKEQIPTEVKLGVEFVEGIE